MKYGFAFRRPLLFIAVALTVLIILAQYWQVGCFSSESDARFTEDTHRAMGTIREINKKQTYRGDDYYCLKIELLSIDDCPVKELKILTKVYDGSEEETEYIKELTTGMDVSVTGTLKKPEDRRNPGCFDYALYLKSIGIDYTFNAIEIKSIEGIEHGAFGKFYNALSGRLYVIKESFFDRLGAATDEQTSALMRGIMFGDKSLLSDDIADDFQKNQTAHILAVSGLHIGIIYAFLRKLWLWRRGWIYIGIMGSFFVCYMILSGFSPSVVRAVLMVLLHMFADKTRRRYDLNSGAFLVYILVLLRNPYMLFNGGFQMSFLAVLTMALIMPYIKRFYSGIFAVTLSVQIGLLPYIIYNFNCFSPIGILINVPVTFIAGIILPAGLVDMLIFCGPISDAIKGLCDILVKLNEMAVKEGFSYFTVASPHPAIIGIIYLSVLVFASETGRLAIIRYGKSFIRGAAPVVITAGLLFGIITDDGFRRCEVVFVDVGQGDCVHMRVDGGLFSGERNYLFDGGGSEDRDIGKEVLMPYLLKNGVRQIDGAFVTHLHTDHYLGICQLARLGMVKRLFVYEGNRLREEQILQETGLKSEDITYLVAGDYIELKGNIKIKSAKDHNGKRGFNKQEYNSKQGYIREEGQVGNSPGVLVISPERETDAEYRRFLLNEEDENSTCLVMKVYADGGVAFKENTSILITGDIDGEKFDEISKAKGAMAPDCNILKVPHHGSKYSISPEFERACQPQVAVFQVGRNTYGHPTAEALDVYKNADIYRNDLDGAVGVEIRRGSIRRIKTMID